MWFNQAFMTVRVTPSLSGHLLGRRIVARNELSSNVYGHQRHAVKLIMFITKYLNVDCVESAPVGYRAGQRLMILQSRGKTEARPQCRFGSAVRASFPSCGCSFLTGIPVLGNPHCELPLSALNEGTRLSPAKRRDFSGRGTLMASS